MSDIKNKLSREDIAKIEIGKTQINKTLIFVIVGLFLTLIIGYPLFQAGYEINHEKLKTPQSWSIFSSLTKPLSYDKEKNLLDNLFNNNKVMLDKINCYEADLKDHSLLQKYLLPSAQQFFSEYLKNGNEKAFIGREGFLFFNAGIKYLTNPGFLKPEVMKLRFSKADVKVDPCKAIIQFNESLLKRNIKLIIMPTTIKPMIYADKFTKNIKWDGKCLQNPSFNKFKEKMAKAGVLLFDPSSVLCEQRDNKQRSFLLTDTHWTPSGMQSVAKKLSEFIKKNVKLNQAQVKYQSNTKTVSRVGDIAVMLQLPNVERLFPKESVKINQVSQNNMILKSKKSAEILLLGDSFSNIYSLAAMNWGDGAGLAEHLAYNLSREIDTITRNDAGAYATREILSKELRKGNDRLSGKKLIIWQFAIRELSEGDWKILDMNLGDKVFSDFFIPKENNPVIVTGQIADISVIPKPGSVPYKDHVMSVHLTNINGNNSQALVYMQSMKDNKLSKAAKLKNNQNIKVKLYNFIDVEDKLGSLNRSELDDEDINLEDPCFGELISTDN